MFPKVFELNHGFFEDSDSVITIAPTKLQIVGVLRKGALAVRIIDNDRLSDQVFYYHQPEHSDLTHRRKSWKRERIKMS